MEPIKITSALNEQIKRVVKLHSVQERKRSKRFIVEGTRTITTALTRFKLDSLFCTEKTLAEAKDLAPSASIILIADSLMKKISTTITPSGLLAVLKIPDPTAPEFLQRGLVLAQVHDPGNMGTLIRTAAACNIKSVVVIEGADPWSPKVLQASAGTHAYVDLFQWDWQQLIAHKRNLLLYALVVNKGQPPTSIDQQQALLVIGSEAHGLPDSWVHECDEKITLPMPGAAESLNAAIAGSIVMYNVFVGPSL